MNHNLAEPVWLVVELAAIHGFVDFMIFKVQGAENYLIILPGFIVYRLNF